MPPEAETKPEEAPEATAARPRRIVFPWVWLGGLLAARLALQPLDITVDFKTIATLVTIVLSTIGVAFWYAIRGRGPLALRLAVGVSPVVGFLLMNTFFQLRHSGDGWIVGIHRRGAETADARLERLDAQPPAEGIADWSPRETDYPRFLGANLDGEAVAATLAEDWDTNPPEELWRREIGAGWSSFAVVGDYAITQEQRGGDELVVCYDARTGKVAWSHSDPARFDPQDFAGNMGRVGPRATPTIDGERVYSQGASGLVTALSARTGELLWSVDTVDRYDVEVPVWGKSGSPLVVDAGERRLVVVNVGVPEDADPESYDASLIAFDAETGEEVWTAGGKQTSYASPQPAKLGGRDVVLQSSDDVLGAYAVEDGSVLLEHSWPGQSDNMPSCSQPRPLADGRLLLTKGYGYGASLVEVTEGADGLESRPVWSPPVRSVLQTKFSNVVIRDGHAYGLNGVVLQCVDIETGKAVWKKRRRPSFGFGQVLGASDYLIALTETGEVVLIEADAKRYRERASLQVLSEEEICWNNPTLVGDLLLVRNAAEAVGLRLPTVSGETNEAAAEDDRVAAR